VSHVFRGLSRVYKTARAIHARRTTSARHGNLPKSILTSGGAAATTSTLVLLVPFFWNNPEDRDGLKHLPTFGELRFLVGWERVVFIHRDARISVDSLHARGYCRLQALKLSLHRGERLMAMLMHHKTLHVWLKSALERQAESFISAAEGNKNVHVITYQDLIAGNWEGSNVFTSAEQVALLSLDSVRMEASR